MYQYCYDHSEINTYLVYWLGRGRRVRIVFDKGQVSSLSCKQQPARMRELSDAGAELRLYTPMRDGQNGFPIMHAKTVMIDGTAGFFGSVNATYNGMTLSKEVLLKVGAGKCMKDAQADFEATWLLAEEITSDRVQEACNKTEDKAKSKAEEARAKAQQKSEDAERKKMAQRAKQLLKKSIPVRRSLGDEFDAIGSAATSSRAESDVGESEQNVNTFSEDNPSAEAGVDRQQ